MLRSLNAVNKKATTRARRWRWALPDPRVSALVELLGGDTRGLVNFLMVSKGLTSQGFMAKEAPPTFLQIEPTRAFGNENLMKAWVVKQPSPNRRAGMARQVVSDQIEVALRICLVDDVQQAQIALRIACWRGQGQFMAVRHTQGAIHPHFIGSATVFKGRFHPMAVRGPTRRGREGAGRDWSQFIDTHDCAIHGRLGVEADDRCPFGTKSGSVLVAQAWMPRQRTFSLSRIRRIWLRLT
jgi:hypothetical protein